MLKSLSIQNYALIDSLDIDFDKGFSVITGETGAGKSIILGALSLILGQRAESKFIKQNEQKCTIEGVFDISLYNLQSLFEERDWEFNADECIIRREIWTNGKSRAFVNDSPVYLTDLKDLGEKLIDIHSQHQNLSLNDNFYQLNVVDILSKSKQEKKEYSIAFKEYNIIKNNLKETQEEYRKNKEEEDYLQFQLDALVDANLQPEEQEVLEEELETITHSEDIKSNLFSVTSILSGDDGSVIRSLGEVVDFLRGIENVFPRATELADRASSAHIDLKDIALEAGHLFESIDFDPDRQQLVEDRLSLIYELQKKHSVTTIGELLDIKSKIEIDLKNISSLDDKIEELEKALLLSQEIMLQKAKALSEKRKTITKSIEGELKEKLKYMGIVNAQFKCDITHKASPDVTGQDNVNFLFSANKNVEVRPVSQIASGGEISRLMLCLKAMMAGAAALPTIIFDEIDTGTSGEIADKMGEIMKQMGTNMQVITITHLPQIAAKGSGHYIVYKEDADNGTSTYMRKLTEGERISEIARMLSGAETTSQAIDNARVMLGTNI